MKHHLALLTLPLLLLTFLQCDGTFGDDGPAESDASSSFWRPADPIGIDLPTDQFYPRGRKFPFSGFAGVPERDRAAGYNLLGPVYVQPEKFLADAKQAGMAVIYPIGLQKEALAAAEENPIPNDEIRSFIQAQVAPLRDDETIAWWYLIPEELRHWRAHELNYLRVAAEAIRESDPHHRPIWIYEPNHRTTESLAITSQYVDVVGKGAYANFAGQMKNRVWIRWSMQQQTDAISTLESTSIPILVPELFLDPDESDRSRIAEWVRHDIVLGLIHGAKGIVVYSLFKRPEVKESFDDYYDAYSGMASELLHDRKLGDVFLFGEPRNDLTIKQLSGPPTASIARQDDKVESDSLTEKERQTSAVQSYPTISSSEYAFGNKRFLFLCNSSYEADVKLVVTGFPAKTTLVTEAFRFNFLHPRVSNGELTDVIPPLGVRCYVFSEFSPVGY